MSEVEKHYGVGADESGTKSPRRSSAPGTDESLVEQASEKLAETRKSAARTSQRLRGAVSDGYDDAQDWASESYDALSRNAVYARRRSAAEFNRGRRHVATFVEENPIMVGVAGLAAGLLIGAILPSTRRENRLLGPYADDLRREGVRYARDVAEQGREVISENLRAVVQPQGDGPR